MTPTYVCYRCHQRIEGVALLVRVRSHPGLDRVMALAPDDGRPTCYFVAQGVQTFHVKCVPPNQAQQAWQVAPALVETDLEGGPLKEHSPQGPTSVVPASVDGRRYLGETWEGIVTCPHCTRGFDWVAIVGNLSLCPGCLRSVVLEEGVLRLARAADTVPLSETGLASLRLARKRYREAQA